MRQAVVEHFKSQTGRIRVGDYEPRPIYFVFTDNAVTVLPTVAKFRDYEKARRYWERRGGRFREGMA